MCDVFDSLNYCAAANTTANVAIYRGACNTTRLLSTPECLGCDFSNEEERIDFMFAFSDAKGTVGNGELVCGIAAASNGAGRRFTPSLVRILIAALLVSFVGVASAAPSALKCSGFRIDSQQPSYLPSRAVGQRYDGICSPGGGGPCPLLFPVPRNATSATLTSTLVTDDGRTVTGLDVAAVFGGNHTESVKAAYIGGFTRPVRGNGYVAVSCKSVLYKGAYTGCTDAGDVQGQANVALINRQIANLVLTS